MQKCKTCKGDGCVNDRRGGLSACPDCHCRVCGKYREEHRPDSMCVKFVSGAEVPKIIKSVHRFIDKQLKPPPKSYQWACANGETAMGLLGIVHGVYQCPGGMVVNLLPRQRKRAKHLLYDLIHWYEKTPRPEIDRMTALFNRQFQVNMEEVLRQPLDAKARRALKKLTGLAKKGKL